MKDSFGGDFWAYFVAAIVSALVVWLLLGDGVFQEAVREDIERLRELLPRMLAAISVAGLLWAMLPRERVARLIGRNSGLRGLVVASAAGILTPGGPASAFPLLALLGASGADRGAMIAYITAWSTMGLQRILVWDVPFMGAEFSLTRFLISLPLPILAGLIARRLPFEFALRDPEETSTGRDRGARP